MKHFQDFRFALVARQMLQAIDDLIAQGKVLYGGVSLWSAENIGDAVKLGRELGTRRLISNQPQYHIFQREIETNGVMEICAREGLGLIVYSPLARGMLSGKYTSIDDVPPDSRAADKIGRTFMGPWFSEEGLEKVRRLKNIAAEAGLALAEMALAWCLHQAQVSSAIIGATKVEQVEANARAGDIELPEDVLAAIDAVAPA